MVACNHTNARVDIQWPDEVSFTDLDNTETIVVEKVSFSPNDVSSMISSFVGEDFVICTQYNRSKQEWKSLLDIMEENKNSWLFSESNLKNVEELMTHAPDAPTFKTTDFTSLSKGVPTTVSIIGSDGTVTCATLDIGNNNFSFYRSEYLMILGEKMWENNLLFCDEDERDYLTWLKPNPGISEKEAFSIAIEAINSLAIPLELFYYEPCTIIMDYVNRLDGWTFVFTRQVNGYPCQFWEGQWFYINPDVPPLAGSPWGQEACTITVNEKGVSAFHWIGASTEIQRKKNEQLDNTEIKPKVEKQIFEMYKTHSYKKGAFLEFSIIKIEAGISLISNGTDDSLGEYVPSWYITYRYKWHDIDDDPINWEEDQIVFNMLNGNYVEPRITERKLCNLLRDYSHDG